MMSEETLPDHLVLLPGETAGRWGLWRTLSVRGAGFPAAGVLRLADAGCTAAADRLAVVEGEAETLRQAALEALRGERGAAGRDRLKVLAKALRRVERGEPAAVAEGLAAATASAVGAWEAAIGSLTAERATYQAAFAAAAERLDHALRAVAADERFREAVLWQNRHAATTGVATFLRRSVEEGPSSKHHRQQARMLAFYLQRYCTKNDTIGFFGPVGWARLTEGAEVITVRPGKELLAARQVYFEGWAIDAIAERLAEDEAMRPWLAPRLSPYLRREGNLYITSSGRTIELGPLSSALIAGCDGTRSARELIAGLGDLTEANVAVLTGMLGDFHAQGILRWGFQIPMSPTPELSLRELLLAIGDEPLREPALALLDEMIRGRDAVTRAAGKPDELERALGDLETTFTRATGKASTRGDGQLYAGRTLVYEECLRDLDVELGAPFLAELAPALSLVLSSARWFTHYLKTSHREMFAQVYAELSAQMGSAQVDVLTFSRTALPRIVSRQPQREMQNELQARWERVLALPPGERRVAYRSADLRPLVQREFAAPGPGWQKARYHSPDLLIAASSVEAIRQGDYQVVLGEVHSAMNALDRWVFFTQHPHPELLRAAIASDLPEPSIIPISPKTWRSEEASAALGLPVPAASGRTDTASRLAKDYFLDFSLEPSGLPSSRVLPIGELVVEPGADGLVVGPRDGSARFGIIDFYQLVMNVQTLQSFRVLPAGTYTPRVTIDKLVVTRESWALPARTLDFAQEPTGAERFAAVRRWAGRRAMPRFLYAKTPLEKKPFYIDLESPILVENFAKAIRRAAKSDPEAPINVSEMLPELDRTWLPDAAGNRYTCELRMVALDLE
jgi:hypothetical protein